MQRLFSIIAAGLLVALAQPGAVEAQSAGATDLAIEAEQPIAEVPETAAPTRRASLNLYIENLKLTAAAGGDYVAFVRALDPTLAQTGRLAPISEALAKAFGGAPVTFDPLFVTETGDKGARIVATLWRDRTYIYAGLVLHERPEGWIAAHTTFHGSYDGVMNFQ